MGVPVKIALVAKEIIVEIIWVVKTVQTILICSTFRVTVITHAMNVMIIAIATMREGTATSVFLETICMLTRMEIIGAVHVMIQTV